MPYRCTQQSEGKWVKVKKETGEVVSHHASKEMCEASIAAYYANKAKEISLEDLQKAATKYTPPEAGPNAPAEVKRILTTVYSVCRKDNPGEDMADKAKCAQISWGAVHNAGWLRGPDGKWTKKSFKR